MVAFTTILLYGTTFFRVRFELPVEYASFVILGGALFYTLGGLTGGRLINRFGRKPSTVLTTFLSGAFTVSYAFMPNLWLSLGLNFVAGWFFGMVAAAANCLTLEQLPKFRGTMMSVDSAAVNLGSAVGGAIGGLALLWFDYEGVGSVLGAMGVLAALVFYFFATDPTRT
jgi:MFS family permease